MPNRRLLRAHGRHLSHGADHAIDTFTKTTKNVIIEKMYTEKHLNNFSENKLKK